MFARGSADGPGLVDQLLQTLKEIDPSRGDRLDDRPEVEVSSYHALYELSADRFRRCTKTASNSKARSTH